jgi:hypothetical protein
LKAVTVVDGETIESQDFPAPTLGGIRLLLVATDKEKEAKAAAAASAPAISGQVVLSDQSRIVLQPGDETLEVFYILTITNSAQSPVNPPSTFMLDMPTGATGTTVLQGSSPKANAVGAHVSVQGPFPPGDTVVEVACDVPITSGTLNLSLHFPAAFPQVTVIAKKVDDMRLTSPQIDRQQDMVQNGDTFIVGGGGPIAAGQILNLTLSGLPHHNEAPRWTALSLAGAIVLAGIWGTSRPTDPTARRDERKRLIARREKLFQELVRLEHDRVNGRGDRSKQAARRDELMAALEQVYGSLDAEDTAPGNPDSSARPSPADRSGLSA